MVCQVSLVKTYGLMRPELEYCRGFTKKPLMLNLQSALPRNVPSEPRKPLRKQQRGTPEMDVASAAETGVFFLFAAITLGGALGLIFAQRVAHSMLSLIFCFMAVSGIFILLGAEFLAAIQILVYLASVGLVVLFGIMLTRRQILEEDFE
ncbi:MAG: hypothetical protein CMA65_04015 [Euryarchaeota archaeon]|nr:hypothetical protein [Euryarchaeota archaeon]MBQ70638.1 hypothetical protein [Euryarchaeota archaeon]